MRGRSRLAWWATRTGGVWPRSKFEVTELKITETTVRECCQPKDLKPVVGPGKPIGRHWFFCQACGRQFEDLGSSEPESPGVQSLPWPWQTPVATDPKKTVNLDGFGYGEGAFSRPVTPPDSILCGKTWTNRVDHGRVVRDETETCLKPKNHAGDCTSRADIAAMCRQIDPKLTAELRHTGPFV